MSVLHILRLLLCGLYWLVLTIFLLVPNPAGVLQMPSVPFFPWGDVGVHLAAFTILALLVCAARWPKPIGWPATILLVYAVATESLQALVPPRTVELKDYAENMLGIALGLGLYWCLRRAVPQAGAEDALSRSEEIPLVADETVAK